MGKVFECNIKGLKLEYGKYTKALDTIMRQQLKEAAKDWLRAVVERTPVYSGESRGSLLPLAAYLNEEINISPAANWLIRKQGPTSLGADVGESEGRYSFTSSNYVYTFSFATDVPQYLINEFNVGLGSPPLINPTPWLSLEAGEQALFEYLDRNILANFPKVSDFVVEVKDLS